MQPLSVGEAARETGVSVDTLRYYEREDLLRVERSPSGHRRYREGDLGWIRILTCLRDTGMPIRRMREFAALVRGDESNIAERVRLLEAHREEVCLQLRATEANLEHLEGKLAHYRSHLQKATEGL